MANDNIVIHVYCDYSEVSAPRIVVSTGLMTGEDAAKIFVQRYRDKLRSIQSSFDRTDSRLSALYEKNARHSVKSDELCERCEDAARG